MTDVIEWYEWPDREDEYVRGGHDREVALRQQWAREADERAKGQGAPHPARRARDMRAETPSH